MRILYKSSLDLGFWSLQFTVTFRFFRGASAYLPEGTELPINKTAGIILD